MRPPQDHRASPPLAVVTTTIPLTALTFCGELLTQLADNGFRTLVVSSPDRELQAMAERGVPTEAIPMTRGISPAADMVSLHGWIRLLRHRRPAMVLAATPKAALLSLSAAWLTGVPKRIYLLWGLRLEGEGGQRRRLLIAMERITGAAATTIVANSPSLTAKARSLKLFRRSKLKATQPGSSHGVDTGYFQPVKRDPALLTQLGLNPDSPTLGFIGRLTRDKGIDTLIDALSLVRSAHVECQVIVVSPTDEPDSAFYRGKLAQVGIPVSFAEPQRDVRPYYAAIDVLVLPSLREGFPNVILEAAAMAIPAITTDATGCIDSVIPYGTGLIHRSGDAAAMSRCIQELVLDPQVRERMGTHARTRVVRDFTPERIVSQTLSHADLKT